jgi:hypothetical protein
VHTTLYDLIEAMHEVVAADEDERVVQAIIQLFDTGRLVFRTAAAQPTLPAHLREGGVERTAATGPGHEAGLSTIRANHPTDISVGFR